IRQEAGRSSEAGGVVRESSACEERIDLAAHRYRDGHVEDVGAVDVLSTDRYLDPELRALVLAKVVLRDHARRPRSGVRRIDQADRQFLPAGTRSPGVSIV